MPLSAVWITVALFFVLVAAAVPALLQLRRTLATAERTLESTGRRVDQSLDELSKTLARVDRAAAELETGTQRVASLFRALGEVGDSIAKIKSALGSVAKFSGAVGPVLIAAMRAFLGGGDKHAHPEESPVEPPLPPAARSAPPHPEPMEVEP